MTDPIADMLNQMMNAQAVKKGMVEIPFSRQKYAIAKILEKSGFVKHADFKGRRARKTIEIGLRYEHGIPRIAGVKRVSKPGQRIYAPFRDIKRAISGRGIAILSTSKGLLSDEEARKEKVGGEVVCEVY